LKQATGNEQPDTGYSCVSTLPSFTFSGCADTESTNYYPFSDEPWSAWIGHDHVALVEKVATTHPYSLDNPVSPGLRQYAINQPFFSPSSSGPPSMARSDGSASTGVIPPPITIPTFAQGYGIANPEEETKYTGGMGNRGFPGPELCGEADAEYEPDTGIYLHEFAAPSLGYASQDSQF
jgi:hypothetical protein